MLWVWLAWEAFIEQSVPVIFILSSAHSSLSNTLSFGVVLLSFTFWARATLHSPAWPRSDYVDQAYLELTTILVLLNMECWDYRHDQMELWTLLWWSILWISTGSFVTKSLLTMKGLSEPSCFSQHGNTGEVVCYNTATFKKGSQEDIIITDLILWFIEFYNWKHTIKSIHIHAFILLHK